jgi:hypothetical protein
MKYLLSLLVMLFAVTFCYAQNNSFPTPSGNATIGNGNYLILTDPTINTTSGITWFGSSPISYGIYRSAGSWNAPDYQQLKIHWDTGIILEPGNAYGKSYVDINGGGLRVTSGYLGIGTTQPLAQLQVGAGTSNTGSSVTMLGGAASGGAVNALSLVNSAAPGTGNEVDMTFHTAGNYSPTAQIGAIAQASQPTTDLAFSTYDASIGIREKMRILGTGNVGIGTTQPDQKLTVNGTIHSKEVKVDTSMPPPDYVFDADYKLPSLTEVKYYIAKNHHLPEIPSAAQIEKDGLKLGEMNMVLLKKVEELTLHLIEKDSEIEDLKKQKTINQLQQVQLDQLKQQLEVLTKEIHKN